MCGIHVRHTMAASHTIKYCYKESCDLDRQNVFNIDSHDFFAEIFMTSFYSANISKNNKVSKKIIQKF